jgi:MarR family transcriptional regulator, organic hydroperoxide resistance regulator
MAELLDLYGRTTKAVRAATDAALRRHGVRLGQDHLLAQLWGEDGRTPGEVASAMGVTTPAVTKGATVLEKAGLLARRPDPNDNRLVRLWLTETGQALREPVELARHEVEEALLGGLSPREVAQFRRTLEKVQRSATNLARPAANDRRQ